MRDFFYYSGLLPFHARIYFHRCAVEVLVLVPILNILGVPSLFPLNFHFFYIFDKSSQGSGWSSNRPYRSIRSDSISNTIQSSKNIRYPARHQNQYPTRYILKISQIIHALFYILPWFYTENWKNEIIFGWISGFCEISSFWEEHNIRPI